MGVPIGGMQWFTATLLLRGYLPFSLKPNETLIGQYVGQVCSKSVPVNGTALLLAVVLPTERCFMRHRVSEMKVKGFCNRVRPECTIKAVKPVTFFCSEH